MSSCVCTMALKGWKWWWIFFYLNTFVFSCIRLQNLWSFSLEKCFWPSSAHCTTQWNWLNTTENSRNTTKLAQHNENKPQHKENKLQNNGNKQQHNKMSSTPRKQAATQRTQFTTQQNKHNTVKLVLCVDLWWFRCVVHYWATHLSLVNAKFLRETQ